MVRSKASKIGDWIFVFICTLVIIICILPVLNVAARSVSEGSYLYTNKVLFWPKGLNFNAYSIVLRDSKYTTSLGWTAILTVICTIWSMLMTVLCAYPLTYDKLKGHKIFNGIILLTMYFNAGTIPHYLLYKDLGLLDNPLVLIIPNCLSVFNMIIMRSFFYGIPESLRESGEIDGANPFVILVKIYLPLSTSVLATLALFYAVGRWNGFSDALMYMLNKPKYYPIQLLLYNMLNSISSSEIASQEGFTTPGLSESLQCAVIMFATVPILCIYPWLQKYFITGVTLGAVKE